MGAEYETETHNGEEALLVEDEHGRTVLEEILLRVDRLVELEERS